MKAKERKELAEPPKRYLSYPIQSLSSHFTEFFSFSSLFYINCVRIYLFIFFETMLLRDRLTRFLLLLCTGLLFAANLSEAVADDKLVKFHKQSASSRGSKGLIQLNDELYDELTSAPRSYSVMVLLTALDPRFNCEACTKVQPEFELV